MVGTPDCPWEAYGARTASLPHVVEALGLFLESVRSWAVLQWDFELLDS